jgi:hypothetical protein
MTNRLCVISLQNRRRFSPDRYTHALAVRVPNGLNARTAFSKPVFYFPIDSDNYYNPIWNRHELA